MVGWVQYTLPGKLPSEDISTFTLSFARYIQAKPLLNYADLA